MVHTLFWKALTNKTWALAHLTECVSRNTEATDEVEDMVSELNSLENPGDMTNNTPIKEATIRTQNRNIQTFPKMRTLHGTKRD